MWLYASDRLAAADVATSTLQPSTCALPSRTTPHSGQSRCAQNADSPPSPAGGSTRRSSSLLRCMSTRLPPRGAGWGSNSIRNEAQAPGSKPCHSRSDGVQLLAAAALATNPALARVGGALLVTSALLAPSEHRAHTPPRAAGGLRSARTSHDAIPKWPIGMRRDCLLLRAQAW